MSDEHDKHDGGGGHGGGGGHAKGGHGGGGHGGDDHEEAHEGAPEWLISFADNVALLMGFFVIMLAMNMAPKGGGAGTGTGSGATAQQLDWALGVREGFNNPVSIDSKDPRDQALVRRLKERAAGESKGPKGTHDRTQSMERGQRGTSSAVIHFTPDSATLSPDSKNALTEVARSCKGLSIVVEVRGHTSAAENVSPEVGYKLSFDRTMAAAEHLAAHGVSWKQIRLVPYGGTDRINPRAYDVPSATGNRRVEIFVTDELVKN